MATINGIKKMSWAEFTAIPNGTRVLNHYYDQCVALANLYNQGVLGGSFVGVSSAYQWWDRDLSAIYTRSSRPVAGSVVVWNSSWGAGHGHVGVVVSVNSNGTFNTLEQNGETWRYVGRYTRNLSAVRGFFVPKNNPATAKLGPKQRKVGANPVKRRQGASTSSKELQPRLEPHTVGNFTGWIRGQQVNDGIKNSNIWFKGTSGDYFWAGGFTSQSTSNLTDLNTPALKANERKVAGNPSNGRTKPNSNGTLKGSLKAGAIQTFTHWTKGQQVKDNYGNSNIWFKTKDGTYYWAGAFTSQATTGLTEEKTLKATERQVGKNPSNGRKTANTTASVVSSLKAGSIQEFTHYTKGQQVNDGYGNSNIWFKTKDGTYYWSGAFTSQATTGLIQEIDNKPTPPPVVETPKPETPKVDKPLRDLYGTLWDISGDEGIKYLKEVIPAGPEIPLPEQINETFTPAHTNGFSFGKWEGEAPTHFVIHHTAGVSLSGAVSTLGGSNGAPTANYVVKDNTVVGMVAEENTAWTNGRWTSNAGSITFELCNDSGNPTNGFTPPSEQTHETTAWLLARSYMLWEMEGKLVYGVNVFGHKDVSKSATSCPGETDIKAIVARANEIIEIIKPFYQPTPPVNPEQPVTPTTPSNPAEWETVTLPVIIQPVGTPGRYEVYVKVKQPK